MLAGCAEQVNPVAGANGEIAGAAGSGSFTRVEWRGHLHGGDVKN